MRLTRLSASVAALSIILAAGCGDGSDGETSGTEAAGADSSQSETTSAGSGTTSVTPGGLEEPEVSVPDELPTELVVTDLVVGTGPAAAEGDTVLVHYVGVRSEDGTEFDSSYDSGQPFPVTLGLGNVIPGWDQGLIGIQAGGRRQLDIPADLAYGDQPQGDVIQAGDALTFVIDALVVVPPSDLDDAPVDSVPTSTDAESLTTEDVVVGDGAEVVDGSNVFVEIVAYRGDTGEEINSTWGNGGPVSLTVTSTATLPGLYEGLLGMKVGGRRQMTMPPAEAFGAEGSEELGLPADTDLVVVVDLVALY